MTTATSNKCHCEGARGEAQQKGGRHGYNEVSFVKKEVCRKKVRSLLLQGQGLK